MNRLCWTIWMGLAVAPALAHDAWVMPQGPRHEIVYGHLDKLERKYDAAKIKAVSALDASGRPLKIALDRDSLPVTIAAPGAAMILLEFDNGYWTKTTEGSKNLPKNQVPGALSSLRSFKYGKTVLEWGPAAAKGHGQRLEIVPETSAPPRPGGMLTLRVEFEGKPLAGASIQLEGYDRAVQKTDAQGRATLTLAPAIMQAIVAGHEIRLNREDADSEKHSANLVFEAR